MRMSISTTSGACAHDAEHLLAVGGLADDFDVGLGFEHHLQPGAHERLVVGDDDADAQRKPRTNAEAAAGHRARVELAAEQRGALAHADDSVRRSRAWPRGR